MTRWGPNVHDVSHLATLRCASALWRYHPQTSAGGLCNCEISCFDLDQFFLHLPAMWIFNPHRLWLVLHGSHLDSHRSTILMKMGPRQQLFFDNVNPATRLLEKRRQMSLPESPDTAAWNCLACGFHCLDYTIRAAGVVGCHSSKVRSAGCFRESEGLVTCFAW